MQWFVSVIFFSFFSRNKPKESALFSPLTLLANALNITAVYSICEQYPLECQSLQMRLKNKDLENVVRPPMEPDNFHFYPTMATPFKRAKGT